jgi:hypothetical protein
MLKLLLGMSISISYGIISTIYCSFSKKIRLTSQVHIYTNLGIEFDIDSKIKSENVTWFPVVQSEG